MFVITVEETEPLIKSVTVQHHAAGGKLVVHRPESWMKLVEGHDLCISLSYRSGSPAAGDGKVWCALTPDDAIVLAEALTVFSIQQTQSNGVSREPYIR
jgi:hypothetical protein